MMGTGRRLLRWVLRQRGLSLSRLATSEPHPRGAAIRLDYPVHPEPRYGYGKPPHAQIADVLRRDAGRYRATLDACGAFRADLTEIPLPPLAEATQPHWSNPYFSSMDAAALYCLPVKRVPSPPACSGVLFWFETTGRPG